MVHHQRNSWFMFYCCCLMDGGPLTLGVAEHLVVFKRRHLGHELLHGLLRGHGGGLWLAVRRLIGGGAALPAVVGGL